MCDTLQCGETYKLAGMKVYTKTGDDGSTGLLGGSRVSKQDLRIECYGTVDELNSHLGLLSVWTNYKEERLREIQDLLFNIGSLLASKDPDAWKLPRVQDEHISLLEEEMDQMNADLPDLKNFVLPGGTQASAQAHISRCVCRRAERRCVALIEEEKIDQEIIKYLNRLSDWLFVYSRAVLHLEGYPDRVWNSK